MIKVVLLSTKEIAFLKDLLDMQLEIFQSLAQEDHPELVLDAFSEGVKIREKLVRRL